MPLQNYLQASRSLAKLVSLGDIRESHANDHIVSSLLDVAWKIGVSVHFLSFF